MTIIRNVTFGFLLLFICAYLPVIAYGQPSASVLCYHAFLDKQKKDPYCFTIEELQSHIRQLKDEGFRFVSVNDLVSGRISGSKNVLITVDDGNKSVYEAYQKVFKPNGIRPLLGIYPNIIGKKKYALTWEQLKRLADDGCDIAAHGYFHLKVNQRLYDKNPAYFNKEIYDSKQVLEERLNKRIFVYVYPFGLRSDITIKALKNAGYKYAFTIDRGKINSPVSRGRGVYELPRYMVTRTGWKYCFNSVVRNARPRGPMKVASASDADTRSVSGADTDRYDPGIALASSGVEKPSKPAKKKHLIKKERPVTRKQRGKTDRDKIDIVSGEYSRNRVPLARPAGLAAGIPERNQARDVQPDRGVIAQGEPARSERQAETGVHLAAKVDSDLSKYYVNIKKTYNKFIHETFAVYSNYLSLVGAKVNRFKRLIKQYVQNYF